MVGQSHEQLIPHNKFSYNMQCSEGIITFRSRHLTNAHKAEQVRKLSLAGGWCSPDAHAWTSINISTNLGIWQPSLWRLNKITNNVLRAVHIVRKQSHCMSIHEKLCAWNFSTLFEYALKRFGHMIHVHQECCSVLLTPIAMLQNAPGLSWRRCTWRIH